MEFENVNNFNLALEAAAKKKSRGSLVRSITHALKKMLRRAKTCCSAPVQPMSSEEMDNAQNEALESKFRNFDRDVERDLRPFAYVTGFQVATRQS